MAKKVVAIVSLVIIGLLISATLIMANVKVDYGVPCKAPDIIRVLKPGAKDADPVSGKTIQEIQKRIKNSSKASSLTALFNGTLFDNANVVTDKTTASTINTKSGCYYVQYAYNQAQVLKVGSKNYKENGSNYLYKELWFEISNLDGVNEFNVYIVPFFDDNGEENFNSKISAKHYVVSADFGALYSYLTENFK